MAHQNSSAHRSNRVPKDPSIRKIRLILIVTGGVFLVLGALCVIAPGRIAAPIEWFLGGTMIATGIAGVFHLFYGFISSTPQLEPEPLSGSSGSSSASVSQRSPVWTLVLLQIVCGACLLLFPTSLRPYLFLLVIVAILIEGGIVLWASIHFSSLKTKAWMLLCGAFSWVVAVIAIWHLGDPKATLWIGGLIGAKLALFGSIFLAVGVRASADDLRCAYIGLARFQSDPEAGSIYAVYYGPAFHCGICVGDRQIVDYLTDGVVRLISWDEFLLGRRAMEWNYPDLQPASPEQVTRFSRSLAGKYNPYDALRFNCENLAIYCRTAGATTYSAYSQAAIGVEFVRRHPWLGSMVQLMNRGASWFLYGMGGPFGKQVGFAMIRLARMLTDWMIARPLRQLDSASDPTASDPTASGPTAASGEPSSGGANHQWNAPYQPRFRDKEGVS